MQVTARQRWTLTQAWISLKHLKNSMGFEFYLASKCLMYKSKSKMSVLKPKLVITQRYWEAENGNLRAKDLGSVGSGLEPSSYGLACLWSNQLRTATIENIICICYCLWKPVYLLSWGKVYMVAMQRNLIFGSNPNPNPKSIKSNLSDRFLKHLK